MCLTTDMLSGKPHYCHQHPCHHHHHHLMHSDENIEISFDLERFWPPFLITNMLIVLLLNLTIIILSVITISSLYLINCVSAVCSRPLLEPFLSILDSAVPNAVSGRNIVWPRGSNLVQSGYNFLGTLLGAPQGGLSGASQSKKHFGTNGAVKKWIQFCNTVGPHTCQSETDLVNEAISVLPCAACLLLLNMKCAHNTVNKGSQILRTRYTAHNNTMCCNACIWNAQCIMSCHKQGIICCNV